MTLPPPGDATDAGNASPRRPRRRAWTSAIAATALAVLLVAVGIVIGRATAPEPGRAEPFDLVALATAWGSGDADQIRAFYTDDAVMMPFGHILSTLNSHPMPEYWDVSGPDMEREADEHEGAILELFGAEQIGNMVVTTGQWTFPEELFPGLADTIIKGTDILHLRDGKIWRHFTDFEVYVDGSLIEM